MAVRNPLVAVLATLVKTAILTPLLLIPVLIFPLLGLPREVPIFYAVAALVVVGFVSGRSGAFAFTAFPVAFLGAFVGYASFAAVFTPRLDLLVAVAYATIAATAAWASATRLMARLAPEVRLENEEKRRCRMCGARVGSKATRCWSCRASLNRIT